MELGKDISMKDGQIRKVLLSRNAYHEHRFFVPANLPRSIRYEFTSEDSVRFGLLFKPTLEEKGFREILKLVEVASHKSKVSGHVEVNSPGYYYFLLHNDTIFYETNVSYFLSWE